MRILIYIFSSLFIFIITISLLIGEDKAWVDCSNEKDLYRYVNEGWKVDKVLKDGDINFGKDFKANTSIPSNTKSASI